MLTFAIILCYLLGVSLMLLISRKYTMAELVGYSFLLGIGFETVFLFLLDVLNIRYTPSLLIGVNVICIAAINAANYKNLLALKSEWKKPEITLKSINPVAVFIFCVLIYLLYAVTVKNLFWPSTEHDTIGSFDKLGRVMAIEGKLKISLFQWDLQGAGGIYPPLFHSSFAYVYLFGAETAKIITTLFFVSLLSTFYSLVRKYVDATAAMLFTFILMLTPELFSHAALTLGNMPTAAYVCGGGLATAIWLETKERKYFWLGAILMAFVVWIRTDTIAFTFAAIFIVGLGFLKSKNWKLSSIYSAIVIAPFIIWNLYLKFKIGNIPSGKINLGIGYDAERMALMTDYAKAFLFGGHHGNVDGGQLYGMTFVLFFLVLIINLILIYKFGWKKILSDRMYALSFLAVSFMLYFLLFYIVDEKVQQAPIASLMESSFKRGMFCFAPLALFYAATSKAPALFFAWVEKFRTNS
ncbi:MAG: hypothetical protein IPP77_11345 [Bacteroidetes bacterium]|nr:hypothetical protein [Bacteroidota bacterium]